MNNLDRFIYKGVYESLDKIITIKDDFLPGSVCLIKIGDGKYDIYVKTSDNNFTKIIEVIGNDTVFDKKTKI